MSRTIGLLAVALAALVVAAGAGFILLERPSAQARLQDRSFDARDGFEDAAQDKFGEDRVPAKADLKAIPIDGERAMKYLKQLCDIGPRVSGTAGMAKQQELVTKHFEKHGARVARQEFKARQLSQKSDVAMVNLMASWYPDRNRRVILCSHYDTRPAAHEEPDPASWRKPFVSANDGTSGVALLMELAHHMKDFPTGVGVDFVLFDGEEYILDPGVPGIREGDKFFIGSEHFAAEYARQKARLPFKYEAAVLLDLFAHPGARLAIEGYSWKYAPKVVQEVWAAADAVGAKSFKREKGFKRAEDVLDDHIALNEAGIPAIDVIDFDYKHWHKLTDTPDQCSAAQLTEVGKTLAAWLQMRK